MIRISSFFNKLLQKRVVAHTHNTVCLHRCRAGKWHAITNDHLRHMWRVSSLPVIRSPMTHINNRCELGQSVGSTYIYGTEAKSIQQGSHQHTAYEAVQRWKGAGSGWGKNTERSDTIRLVWVRHNDTNGRQLSLFCLGRNTQSICFYRTSFSEQCTSRISHFLKIFICIVYWSQAFPRQKQ